MGKQSWHRAPQVARPNTLAAPYRTLPEKYAGKNFANVTRVWAPQTIYDEKAGKYMVYFSLLTNDGTIPYDRVYWAYANADFSDLEGEPQVLFDFHAPAIDTDIVQDKDGEYHLFFKTEQEGAHKGIRQYVFRDLHDTASWTLLDGFCEQTKDNVEGAGVFPLIGGGWCLMYDCYMSGHYQFTRSETSAPSVGWQTQRPPEPSRPVMAPSSRLRRRS